MKGKFGVVLLVKVYLRPVLPQPFKKGVLCFGRHLAPSRGTH